MSKQKKPTDNVTVIVPVYGDWPSLKDCIISLIEHVDTSRNRVMLVNDCGPDADAIEASAIKLINGRKGFEYYRNPENLGFLKNCNRAVLELDKTANNILLLNSDTIVTGGFIEELQRVLEDSSDKIGTVSPRSNNATIATIPVAEAKNKSLDPKKSYITYLKLRDKLPAYNIAPVSHGFCMLIRRDAIDEFGLFDEAFGKGYGEEVDFCMRTRQGGYKSAISNRAFVYHLEARSFTFDVKKDLLALNGKIVDERYPKYMKEVRDYTLKAIEQERQLLQPYITRIATEPYRKMKALLVKNKAFMKIYRTIRQK